MKQTQSIKDKNLNKDLKRIVKQLDMVIAILLVNSGLKRKEIAKILNISEKTIERMIPVRKLKSKLDLKTKK